MSNLENRFLYEMKTFMDPSGSTFKGLVDLPSLRDQFAMAALTGLLANPKLQPEITKTGGAYGGWIEGSAWSWADAMMEKRK